MLSFRLSPYTIDLSITKIEFNVLPSSKVEMWHSKQSTRSQEIKGEKQKINGKMEERRVGDNRINGGSSEQEGKGRVGKK